MPIEIKYNNEKQPHEVALEIRNFEIELFWKRNTIFWAVVAASFVAFASFKGNNSNYATLMSCVGIISSYSWFIMNRGSKAWQENWEKKVDNLNPNIELFQKIEEIDNKVFGAKRYSVSKICIMLSCVILLLWCLITANEILPQLCELLKARTLHGVWQAIANKQIFLVILTLCIVMTIDYHGRTWLIVRGVFNNKPFKVMVNSNPFWLGQVNRVKIIYFHDNTVEKFNGSSLESILGEKFSDKQHILETIKKSLPINEF